MKLWVLYIQNCNLTVPRTLGMSPHALFSHLTLLRDRTPDKIQLGFSGNVDSVSSKSDPKGTHALVPVKKPFLALTMYQILDVGL